MQLHVFTSDPTLQGPTSRWLHLANAQGTDLRTGTVVVTCLMPTHLGVAQVISVAVLGSCTTCFSHLALHNCGQLKRRLLLVQHAAGYRQLGNCHGSAAWTRSSAAVGSTRHLARCQQRREDGGTREQTWARLGSTTHGEADCFQQPRVGSATPIPPPTCEEPISLLTSVGVARVCPQGTAAWA